MKPKEVIENAEAEGGDSGSKNDWSNDWNSKKKDGDNNDWGDSKNDWGSKDKNDWKKEDKPAKPAWEKLPDVKLPTMIEAKRLIEQAFREGKAIREGFEFKEVEKPYENLEMGKKILIFTTAWRRFRV